MKEEYIITPQELAEKKGLDLNDYIISGDKIPAIISLGLESAITRILTLNDDFKYESDIESALDNNLKLVPAFKKLQWKVIYNLIFLGDDDPLDKSVDDIICSDLRWGKINGFQKRVFGNRG